MKTLPLIDLAYTYVDLEVGAQENAYCLELVSNDMADEFAIENLIQAFEKLTCPENCSLRVCGHNFRREHHPRLVKVAPQLSNCQIIDTLELSVLAFPLEPTFELSNFSKSGKYYCSSPLEDARATKLMLYEQIQTLSTQPEFCQELIAWLLGSGVDSSSIAYRQLFCDTLGWNMAPVTIEKLPEEMLAGINCSYLQKLLLNAQSYDFDTRLCVAALLVWNYENNLTQSKIAYSNWLSNLPPFEKVLDNLFGESFNDIPIQFNLKQEFSYTSDSETFCYSLPDYIFRSDNDIEDYQNIIDPLDDYQKEIVLSDDQALTVIGNPGSGKTMTLVHRIAYLVKIKLVDPQSILVLAPNRNSITEMRVKLQQLIGDFGTQVRIFTFPKLSLTLLGRTLDVNSKTQFDVNKLISDACLLFEQNGKSNSLQHRIELLGNLEYLFIDEYQDINDNEYRLIKLISGLNDNSQLLQTNICIIGDNDCNGKYHKFEQEYQAKRLLFYENYRSSESIISAANKLISHNQGQENFTINEEVRLDKMGQSYKGFPIEAYIFDSTKSQAIWIQQRICSRIEQGASLKDIAVFAQSWDSLDIIRLLLEKAGIPTCNLKQDNIELVKNHITCKLIDELQLNRNQLFLPDKSVLEWFENCFHMWGRQLNEPTVQILLRIAHDIDIERGYGITDFARPINIVEVLDALFEYNANFEAVRDENAVLVTTCHGAKKFEYEKVILLADGFSTDANKIEAERRLFYTAMTRAKSELVMCTTEQSQFINETGAEPERLNVKIDFLPELMFCLDLIPDDIFPGHYSTKKNQEVIINLTEGAELSVKVNSYFNGWDIFTVDGQKVGALSQQGNSNLASVGCIPGEFEFRLGEVKVKNIYRHLQMDNASGVVEDWFIVIPQLQVCR
ncbi:hypothetical protein DSM106972_039850 [Dulcicalothrix desertica PCC 7102]|uniref:DNA 3'-5' helicase n=1 Tax=Dulcicalothrix desertica PCC 7102 TaxID=232991 RepID=A0A3S1AN33_9CYAN|nr:ATP-dependent helicase [Dulcicalothrix desertica]RUT05164.1 hypothetical protein DSM106972_039850 [Dulcicalothrix desertica PCC 7102]TWH43330.1 superfamily I DNA/RNA helicase [Dulcicalothrix desertica PCC 7102]